MSKVNSTKRMARDGRRARVRKKVRGTAQRPRLSIYRSLNHIYAQVIDDDAGTTLASASSLKLELPAAPAPDEKKKAPDSVKIRRSVEVGKLIAEKAKEKGIETVIFDRGGFLYHGRIAALADAARENGLKF